MATTYRIHPAIGIARVGNSDEYFIGPERMGERPDPPGGFKDSQCRVKRQAARFRIFAHHDDGTSEEITDAQAEITWTVHVANRKAGYSGRGNIEPAADLAIDPGARSIAAPNQSQAFDTGRIRFGGGAAVTVPLGEMRTDVDNRLLVLGGRGHSASPGGNGIVSFWGNPGWYDDIADGPVSASIRLRSDNSAPSVVGAWIITAPPKFAPHQDSVTTLHDRILQAMVDAGLATAPTATSYTQDIYPILQRTRDIRSVSPNGAHNWTEPVVAMPLRQAIFERLKPVGNMPALAGSDSALTPIQYAHMQRWKDDSGFSNDWTGVPAPEPSVTPAGMDRAALDATVGAAFYPGIEAGGLNAGQRPILDASLYAEAFRINHATVSPGTLSASMALPWQADFYACGGNWWPVPRPDRVTVTGQSGPQAWVRGIGSYQDMVDKWHTLGFVVDQAGSKVESERCDTASITLLTPHIDFADVPQGPMGMVREQPMAISFEIVSPSTAVTLQYAPGGMPNHPQLIDASTEVTVGPTGTGMATARLWIVYRTGAVGSSMPTQTVTVREPVSGRSWDITIDGNTIARRTAAVALVLDRSGSMSEDRGDGISKHVTLQQAAEIFVGVMLEGDGVGLVRYDQDAQVVQPVRTLGAGGLSDLARGQTVDLIRGNSFDPAGATSIGDGLHEGRQILAAAGGFDVKALMVLTDGKENRPRYIADVASQIDARTYAIGLGKPQNISVPALQTLSGNQGGALLITGAIGTDNRFLLQKYFLQVLAGVSNAEVVLDPDGELTPGAVHRIPFMLTEADAGVDVVLLTPYAHSVDFRLQTPNGLLLEPWRAQQEPGMKYVLGDGVSYYRLVLPAQLLRERFDQAGTWHALVTIGKPRLEPDRDHPEGIHSDIARGMHAAPARRLASVDANRIPPNEMQRRFELAHAGEQSWADTGMRSGETARARRSLPYSLIVHSYSSISLRGQVHQDSYEPGARIRLEAALGQSGMPMSDAAQVWAELIRPDGGTSRIDLQDYETGRYAAEFDARDSGVYRIRLRAYGHSRSGMPFSRERLLSAAVWRGGDRDAAQDVPGGHGTSSGNDRLCELLACLLGREGAISPELEKRLHGIGLDIERVRKCLAGHCDHDRADDRR